ncbi:MAG: 3-oxoacyl-[acyl-carrier-protein] synthase III C-terminal domain-containing protein [Candidatus Zixiibacteriota bacterium]
MPRICAVHTAVPPNRFDQKSAEQFAREHFSQFLPDIDRLLKVFSGAGIESRYFSCSLDWFRTPHSFDEKNHIYIESATALSAAAARGVLASAGISASQIDYIIYINTTGLATPSIDARLINLLGMRSNIRRTPVWGLGCAGGVAGLSHAYHYLLGHPTERVLVVATELCGLTFMPDDFSRSNLVASALFGEGSAAVLLAGDQVELPGIEILGTQSRFYPDSLDVMGWNIVSQGMQVIFAQRIPDIVAANAAGDLDGFLNRHGLTRGDIAAWLFHPGGTKVIEAYEKALAFSDGELAISRSVLRDYGNMSSVSVLFVLERYLRMNGIGRAGHGLLSSLGPGFCSESLLVKL